VPTLTLQQKVAMDTSRSRRAPEGHPKGRLAVVVLFVAVREVVSHRRGALEAIDGEKHRSQKDLLFNQMTKDVIVHYKFGDH
jgi:hypothetical protein